MPLSVLTSRAIYFAAVLLISGTAFAADVAEKAKPCAACHGEQGIPLNQHIPVIWGQDEGYLYLQLRDFKSGARKSPLMGPIAATLEKEDMLALAAYFNKLKWPNLQQPPAPPDVAKKAESAAASIGCRGCHLEHFQGDGTTARLAGQWREYLEATILAFRDGSRGNNPGMTNLMNATPAEDIAPLAQYLAGLQIDAYLGSGR